MLKSDNQVLLVSLSTILISIILLFNIGTIDHWETNNGYRQAIMVGG